MESLAEGREEGRPPGLGPGGRSGGWSVGGDERLDPVGMNVELLPQDGNRTGVRGRRRDEGGELGEDGILVSFGPVGRGVRGAEPAGTEGDQDGNMVGAHRGERGVPSAESRGQMGVGES